MTFCEKEPDKLNTLIEGLLKDLPLLGVLELINSTRQTGVLEVQTEVPYTVVFSNGEIVSGGILDWLGPEALYTCPLLSLEGHFSFEARPITGTPTIPYGRFSTDWARISDEWEKICEVIFSPSRLFYGNIPAFDRVGGTSLRSVANRAEAPLFNAAKIVTEAVKDGRLNMLDTYSWFKLKMQPSKRRTLENPVAHEISHHRTLGDAISQGVPIADVRSYLLEELRLGLRFPGSGWVMRDLVWEQKYDNLQSVMKQ